MDSAGQACFSCSARKASEICLRASEKTAGESLTGLYVYQKLHAKNYEYYTLDQRDTASVLGSYLSTPKVR